MEAGEFPGNSNIDTAPYQGRKVHYQHLAVGVVSLGEWAYVNTPLSCVAHSQGFTNSKCLELNSFAIVFKNHL